MKRWWIACLVWVVLSAVLVGQPAPKLEWNHDRVNTTRYEVVIDGVVTNLGYPDPVSGSGPYVHQAPLPALTVGTHTLSVRACNNGDDGIAGNADDVCAASENITVVKL